MNLSVHPSGCATITVGRESFLALINLVRGRKSFSCRLDRAASIVRYGCGYGGRFFMVSEERITVHDSENAKMIRKLNGQKRWRGPLSQCSGDMRSGEIAYSFENAHSTRVKGLVVLKNRSKSETSDESNLIASASSDGMIRVWDARMIAKDKPNHLAEADTKSRLTCLAGSFKKYYCCDIIIQSFLKYLCKVTKPIGSLLMIWLFKDSAINKIKDLVVSIEGKSLEEKKSLLAKCAATTLSSKLIGGEKEFFANMVVEAILAIGNDDRLNLIGIKKFLYLMVDCFTPNPDSHLPEGDPKCSRSNRTPLETPDQELGLGWNAAKSQQRGDRLPALGQSDCGVGTVGGVEEAAVREANHRKMLEMRRGRG
ncbi:hypothetical protein ZIOFF_033455 [Zingiber officinale]|uniref:Transducin/WD40 repeat-like superfamily protein n=1 Tax=Zingiber officinale TaxID=94328 RepID=A0A8J5GKB6_ZINOF|nr:hypothetical protein ZIOFF_033455 [Zingiber officinale]